MAQLKEAYLDKQIPPREFHKWQKETWVYIGKLKDTITMGGMIYNCHCQLVKKPKIVWTNSFSC